MALSTRHPANPSLCQLCGPCSLNNTPSATTKLVGSTWVHTTTSLGGTEKPSAMRFGRNATALWCCLGDSDGDMAIQGSGTSDTCHAGQDSAVSALKRHGNRAIQGIRIHALRWDRRCQPAGYPMLTRLLIKLTCIGVVAAGGMTWLAASQGKDPLAVFSTLSWRMPDGISLPPTPDLPALSDLLPGRAGTSTVYRWTDAQGTVQFSTSPPTSHIRYDTLSYDPQANVLPATPLPEAASAEPRARTPANARGVSNTNATRQSAIGQFGEISSQLDAIENANTNRTRELDAALSRQTR